MEKNIIEDYKRSNEDTIICPYCGYDNGCDDFYDSDECECYECEKNFFVTVNHSINYSTSCDCHKNKKKHKWSEWEYFDQRNINPTSTVFGKKKECLNCDQDEYVFGVTNN